MKKCNYYKLRERGELKEGGKMNIAKDKEATLKGFSADVYDKTLNCITLWVMD